MISDPLEVVKKLLTELELIVFENEFIYGTVELCQQEMSEENQIGYREFIS